jgi:hypothetical protein
MSEVETRSKPSLFGVIHFLIAFATLGALAVLAYEVVSIAFRLGTRIAVRSVLALIVPIFVGSYAFVAHRNFVHRVRRLPAALRFSASLAAGALAMASLRFFLVFYPFPIAELMIASCMAVLAFTSASLPGSNRPLAPYGLAAGMLLYLVVYGVPRIA